MRHTGGRGRASNYIGFMRKAFDEAGFADIPVIAASAQGIESNPGFNIYSIKLINNLIMSTLLGDLLLRVTLRTRPYEKIENSTNLLLKSWQDRIVEEMENINKTSFIQLTKDIVKSFDKLEIVKEEKPKVGIVGEILVKYHPIANNNLIETLEAEGAEVLISDLMDFISYSLYNAKFKNEHLGKGLLPKLAGKAGIKYIETYRRYVRKALKDSENFTAPMYIEDLAEMGEEVVSLGNQSGEGWLLVAEMIELIQEGAKNVVCVQPFGCLPNHIVGKGMIKPIRDIYPEANIIPLDYDPGASAVNQLNRLKLMLSRAESNLKDKTIIKDSKKDKKTQ